MASVTIEAVHNPESDGPIQGLYKKVKTYLPDLENKTIDKLDQTLNTVMGNCDKAVANASHRLRSRVPDIRAFQTRVNTLTQRVLNEVEDRLNNLINKLEVEEAPTSSVVAIKKTEPETRLIRLFRKSRKLNTLVIRKIISEAFRLGNVALHTNYPELILNQANNLILEARVVREVTNDLISEFVRFQMDALKVRFNRTKEGFEFVINELKNPAEARKKISEKVAASVKNAKDITMEVVNNCLQIKINRESLVKYFHLIQDLVSQTVSTVVSFPKKVTTQAIKDSKAIYDRVAKKYKVQKQLAIKDSRPQVAAN